MKHGSINSHRYPEDFKPRRAHESNASASFDSAKNERLSKKLTLPFGKPWPRCFFKKFLSRKALMVRQLLALQGHLNSYRTSTGQDAIYSSRAHYLFVPSYFLYSGLFASFSCCDSSFGLCVNNLNANIFGPKTTSHSLCGISNWARLIKI